MRREEVSFKVLTGMAVTAILDTDSEREEPGDGNHGILHTVRGGQADQRNNGDLLHPRHLWSCGAAMTDMQVGSRVRTEFGDGVVDQISTRRVFIVLDCGDTLNVATGTPGFYRIKMQADHQ